jgi:Domain of unknown function (DUF4118)
MGGAVERAKPVGWVVLSVRRGKEGTGGAPNGPWRDFEAIQRNRCRRRNIERVEPRGPIDCRSQCVLMPPMSIRWSAVQFAGLESKLGSGRRALALATQSFDLARIWIRKAMAPGGVTGVMMALVFIAGTDAFLLFMYYVHELPPVSLTFLIPVFVAAMVWGPLSAAITAIGGGMMITLFFNSPLYGTSPGSRSGILGITVFLAASLVLGYLASKARRDAARALKRENEIRDLHTFSQRISVAGSPAGIFEAMQQHLAT